LKAPAGCFPYARTVKKRYVKLLVLVKKEQIRLNISKRDQSAKRD
jgi:hypothetical protein